MLTTTIGARTESLFKFHPLNSVRKATNLHEHVIIRIFEPDRESKFTNLAFFCSQGTFSLIVEAYHDADNTTHHSAGK